MGGQGAWDIESWLDLTSYGQLLLQASSLAFPQLRVASI